MRISLATAWRRRGIGSAMLGEPERRLAAGVHRIQCLLAGDSDLGALALEHAGYTARRGVVFCERLEPVHPGSAGVLSRRRGRHQRDAQAHPAVPRAGRAAAQRLFTPADIEFARRTAQLAFERVLFEHGQEEVTTADVLQGIAETRRTLAAELAADFEQDIQDYARV